MSPLGKRITICIQFQKVNPKNLYTQVTICGVSRLYLYIYVHMTYDIVYIYILYQVNIHNNLRRRYHGFEKEKGGVHGKALKEERKK